MSITVMALQQGDPCHLPRSSTSFDGEYLLTDEHGGVPVSWTCNGFDTFVSTASVSQPSITLKLLPCIGIGVIAELYVTFAAPLAHDGELRFTKGAHASHPSKRSGTSIALKKGQSRVDLMNYRSLFIAYKDSLVGPLRIDFALCEANWHICGPASLVCVDAGFDIKDAMADPMTHHAQTGTFPKGIRVVSATVPSSAPTEEKKKVSAKKSSCANPTCASGVVDNLQLCGRCKSIHYCSVACQRTDWPVHKQTCKFPYAQ